MEALTNFFSEKPYLSSTVVTLTTAAGIFGGYNFYKKIKPQTKPVEPYEDILAKISLESYIDAEKSIEEFKKTDQNGILSSYFESFLQYSKNNKHDTETLRKIIKKDPTTTLEKIIISQCHRALKEYEKGLPLVEEVLKSENSPPSIAYYVMSQYFVQELITKEQGMFYLKKAMELDNMFAHFEYGLILVDGKFGFEKDIPKGIYHLKQSATLGYALGYIKLGQIYEHGASDVVKKDPLLAFLYYSKAAELGSPNAMVDVGYCYSQGFGTKQNNEKAIEFYEKAYAHGNKKALISIGLMHEEGKGFEKDAQKAIDIYETALAEGVYQAADYLCHIFIGNAGVEKNENLVLKYALKGAEGGNSGSYYYLGRAFQLGLGCQENNETAFKYYKLGADTGSSTSSCYFTALYYYDGIYCELNLELAKYYHFKALDMNFIPSALPLAYIFYDESDYENAYKYFKMSHDSGNSEATYWLGRVVEVGFENYPPNTMLAYHLYLEAYEKGYENADISLGYYFLFGRHGVTDYTQSLEYYKRAALRQAALGYLWIGYHYKNGLGVQRDPILAFQYFKSAYQLGNRKEACLCIGLALVMGEGVPKDDAEALKFFIEGSENGNADCMFNAGVSFERGEGCNIDLVKALEYYKMAERCGHVNASTGCEILPFLMNKWIPDEDAKSYQD